MDIKLIFLSLLIVGVIFLIFFLLFRKNRSKTIKLNKDNNLDPTLNKLMTLFGGDVVSLLPEKLFNNKEKRSKTEELLIKSGNPWNITTYELLILRAVLGVLGIILSIVFSGLLLFSFPILAIPVLIIVPLLLFYYPTTTLESIAYNREDRFRRELPEAIDYLSMTVAGTNLSLPQAIENVTLYLDEDSVLREEFINVSNGIKSGQSVNQALDAFAERVPTEGIKAFIKSLKAANDLSVPLEDILRARSEASRKELETNLEEKLQKLPDKITLILTPIIVICMLTAVLSPALFSILKAF